MKETEAEVSDRVCVLPVVVRGVAVTTADHQDEPAKTFGGNAPPVFLRISTNNVFMNGVTSHRHENSVHS